MEYFIIGYIVLYLVKLPFVLVAAYRDTTYSVRQGYVQDMPWKVYMGLLMSVAVVMSFFMLLPMLFMENVKFFTPYRKDIIERVADKTALKNR